MPSRREAVLKNPMKISLRCKLDWRPELLIYHMGQGAAKRTYAESPKDSSLFV
jgi:hypothetical protein